MIWDIWIRKINRSKLNMFIISKKIFDYRGGGLELYGFLINRAHPKLKNQNQEGGEIMKILNKIYPLFVFWLGLFSISNAKNPNTISPTSPFFNKIIKEEINFNKPQEPIKVSALTFNRVFICAPRNNSV
ncbi:MAG: hypothetical protein ABIL72_07590 [candidate division WOR-3 bacterium]